MVCVSGRENPARPGPLHLAYTLAVSGVTGSSQLSALCAYTTSQPWPGGAMPLGVRAFDRQEAATLGQARPFVMDLRRLAFVPIAPAWFPPTRLARRRHSGPRAEGATTPAHADRNRASDRRSELVEKLGPLWPPNKS
jgi:hypothetical protein